MIIELIMALIVGILIGTLTGLFPGIHINLASAILVSFSAFFLSFTTPLALAVFLVAMAISHTFISYIPSIFLGAPNEDDTSLSILPGHEMLIKGQAYSAVIYTLYGCFAGILLILVLSPIFFFTLDKVYPYAQRIMPFVLIIASIFLIYFEKSSRIWAVIILMLSGLLGISTLNLELNEPLLPLFTGLFGISSLITSISKKQKIPKQKIKKLKSITISKKSFLKSILASIIASPLCSFLPAMGSGQAAVIGSEVSGDLDRKEFLILLGAINTIVTGLSFITLYKIDKARTGVAAAVGKIIELNVKDIYILTATIVLSGLIAFFVTVFAAKVASKLITKIDYRKLSIAIVFILTGICFYFSGWMGLLVMVVSAAVGIVCIYSGVRRTHMMGSLLIPTILYYL